MAVLPRSASNNKRPFRMVRGVSSVYDLVDGGTAPFGYPGEAYPNKVYFVNNITGSSTNDGASWDTAMDQVSTAVTAWEVYRATLATNNQNIRGIIYIAGTGTMYTYLTALPSYCDVIGLGADPRGDGAGIVKIGSDGAYDGATGSMRGANWYNIQFCTGNASTSGFHAAVAYRSVFDNCTFGSSSSAAANPSAGLEITSGSGLVVRNCGIVMHAKIPATGFKFAAAGANFNQCLIEDNQIYGSTAGLTNAGYLSNGTVVRYNTIYGGSYGIQDTSAGNAAASDAMYVSNWVSSASDAIAITNRGTLRALGNWVSNNGTCAIEASVTDITTA